MSWTWTNSNLRTLRRRSLVTRRAMTGGSSRIFDLALALGLAVLVGVTIGLHLRWQPSATGPVDLYRVWRSTDGGLWQVIAATAGTEAQDIVTVGTTNLYRVDAGNAAGWSAPSNIATGLVTATEAGHCLSFKTITPVTNGGFTGLQFTWAATSNRYVVETTTDLRAAWQPLSPVILVTAAGSSVTNWTDWNPGPAPRRFYRLHIAD